MKRVHADVKTLCPDCKMCDIWWGQRWLSDSRRLKWNFNCTAHNKKCADIVRYDDRGYFTECPDFKKRACIAS